MALGEVCGFGLKRVDHPDFAAALVDLLEEHARLVHSGIVGVAHHRVCADIDHHGAVFVVGLGIDAVEMRHRTGQHHLGGAVVGQRREFRPAIERLPEGLLHRVAGRIDAEPAAEIHAHRMRSVLVDDRAQPSADIVERLVPFDFDQLGAYAHHRTRDRPVEVINLARRAALGAGIALGDRMVEVALDLQYLLVVGDLD